MCINFQRHLIWACVHTNSYLTDFQWLDMGAFLRGVNDKGSTNASHIKYIMFWYGHHAVDMAC